MHPTPPAPRIAIVVDWLQDYAGAERVLEQLLLTFPQAEVFAVVDFVPEASRGFLQGKPVHTTFIQRLPLARRLFRQYLPLMPLAVEQLDLSGFDIVISSSHAVAKGVLTGPDQLHVSYVHSPLRYAWDMQHEYLREAGMARGLKSLLTRWLLHRLRLWDVRTANGVDQFVANSAFIARRVRKAYRREAEVIYPPVDLSAFIPSAAARGQAYVMVSRMVPYKRVDLIVEAFAGMPDKQLIVIGDGPEMAKVRAKAGSNVQILGHLPFEAMREHVQRARAFVFAAQEDFGIAPVEAQACGTPVIAYGRGGAAETVRGLQQNPPTGVLFEEQTVEALREAVRQFEQHAARITPAACRQNAERFAIGVFRQRMAALVVSRWSGLQGEVKSGVTGFKPIQPKAL